MTPINRRTFLRSSGVSLALPLLESMTAARARPVSSPKRLVFLCTTLGLHPPFLWPKASGRNYESTEYLSRLRAHRNDFTLFSGLSHEDQTGRQPHDSEMTWLTAARKPGMGGFRNTISVDQVAAQRLGYVTRLPSVTMGTMKPQSQSYTRGGVMIPAETSPARLFGQLFLDGNPEEVRAQKQRLNEGRSILDQLGDETRAIRRRSSAHDNHLLDDYFDSIREAEKNITAVQDWMNRPKPKVEAPPPKDIPDHADLIGRARRLLDLVPLILQTDSSRVVSVMIQDHYVVPKIAGVSGNHHNLSHHGQDPGKIEQLKKIELPLIDSFGGLLSALKARTENGSRLLDHASVLFGSNLGNANAHHAKNLPIFLAGGGFRHGRYVAKNKAGSPEGEPLCNLFVRMLNQAGIETESFGQSSGELTW